MGADQIAIVEHFRSCRLKRQHGAHMVYNRGTAGRHQLARAFDAQALDLLERHALGHIPIDQIMGRGLVGDDIGHDAAPVDLGVNFGSIAHQTNRGGALVSDRLLYHLQRGIEVRRDGFEIADLLALAGAFGIDIDTEDRRPRHAPGQRLRPAHAAEPGRQDEAPRQAAVEAVLGDAHENLIGALNDALAADVLPGARRQPAPADQPLFLQLIEHLGLGPLPDNVAIGHDHQRRLGVGFEQANRLAGLDDQRLILVHPEQGFDNGLVARPIARRLAERGINDQLIGVFADTQNIFQQAQQRLLPPPLGAQLRAARNGEIGMAWIGRWHGGDFQ